MGKTMNLFEIRNTNVFNSPLEIGLRVLYVLNELFPMGCDLQRLVYYDYLLIHSGDVPEGPKSIHPSIPHRSTEILVKRELLKKGLTLMNSKQLVETVFDSTGISFKASKLTRPFIEYNKSEYAKRLKEISVWLVKKFNNYSDDNLSLFIKNNLDIWGGEFSKESLFRGSENEK
ncbi:MAG: ABC-three component system middle component 2 [Ignavibacteria bacterium]